MAFPFYKQLDVMDCGPTCLRMIAKHYGRTLELQSLREASGINREGVSLQGISQAAEQQGFTARGVKISPRQLRESIALPCILHWDQEHFVVAYKATKGRIYVADPVLGRITYTPAELQEHWCHATLRDGELAGIALLLEPTDRFWAEASAQKPTAEPGLGQLFAYLKPYKSLIAQLLLGVGASSALQVMLPFLTQSVIDVGINTNNLSFIYLVLFGQFALITGRIVVDFIRSWILLHISTRISIAVLTDFLSKILRLPLSYFDVKVFGDFMQRVGDQRRIEQFLTGPSLEAVFSFVSLLAFGTVIWYFNSEIFLVYFLATVLYVGWITLFLRSRKKLDAARFTWQAKEQSLLAELLHGMPDIKLANAELAKRWRWEETRAHIFHVSTRALRLAQYQQVGGHFINEGKNVFITFLAAKAVLSGSITLGTMLAMQYIIGQLNGPVEQLITFLQSSQDAKISLERLQEVQVLEDEHPAHLALLTELPSYDALELQHVSYAYHGSAPVLQDISFRIPKGKITAIVGMSGSGKTTLLKLLLKFYNPSAGAIRLGAAGLNQLSPALWRRQCGVVLQEGYIFSDTVAQNIAVGEETIDWPRLQHALRVANIEDLVERLPLGVRTKVGTEGNGLSQGQKQRLLIARAVYKDPEFIFFDEATNALDSNNESIIMRNLEEFFAGRTVIVVAHRLSTVKNADQIVVLQQGAVVECGSHAELLARQGQYYELVHNQLEINA